MQHQSWPVEVSCWLPGTKMLLCRCAASVLSVGVGTAAAAVDSLTLTWYVRPADLLVWASVDRMLTIVCWCRPCTCTQTACSTLSADACCSTGCWEAAEHTQLCRPALLECCCWHGVRCQVTGAMHQVEFRYADNMTAHSCGLPS